MFLLGMPFLLGLLDPLGMLLVKRLRDRSAGNIVHILTEFIATAKSRNFDVQVISCDGEKGVGALSTEINALGITLDTTAAGGHKHKLDRKMRTVKERCRTIIHSLPFTLEMELIAGLALFVVKGINREPTKTVEK